MAEWKASRSHSSADEIFVKRRSIQIRQRKCEEPASRQGPKPLPWRIRYLVLWADLLPSGMNGPEEGQPTRRDGESAREEASDPDVTLALRISVACFGSTVC